MLGSDLGVLAQTDTTYISFVAYWSVGDSIRYKVTKIKQRSNRLGKIVQNDTASYIAKFIVVDSTESSYKIHWHFEENNSKMFGLPIKLEKFFEKQKIDKLIYTTNELGELIDIENHEEILEKLKMMMIATSLVLKIENREEAKNINPKLLTLKAQYSSKEALKTKVFEELMHFHFPYGVEYSNVGKYSYQELYSNLLGGDPIKADVELFIKSYDLEHKKCVLIQKSKLNPDDVKAMLKDFFKQSKLSDKELKKAVFDLSDTVMYNYYFYPGIPIKIEKERILNMQIGKEKVVNIDRVIIEQVD